MAAHSELRNALLLKLGVTPQRLHQMAQARKAELPMSTVHAYYTIAHDRGIDISKYLSPGETAEVRALITQLRSTAPAPSKAANGRTPKRRSTARSETVVRVSDLGLEDIPGLTPAHAREAREMAKVYTAIYLFENSFRDVIECVLSNAFGADWWTKAVPSKIQDKAAGRETDEGRDAWHGKRGARPIDYVDLSDLARIVKDKWKYFAKIFPSGVEWIHVLVTTDMNVSRRVVAHMNPLDKEDIANVKSAYRKYAKALKANHAEIP